jgi:hypothetical protein
MRTYRDYLPTAIQKRAERVAEAVMATMRHEHDKAEGLTQQLRAAASEGDRERLIQQAYAWQRRMHRLHARASRAVMVHNDAVRLMSTASERLH